MLIANYKKMTFFKKIDYYFRKQYKYTFFKKFFLKKHHKVKNFSILNFVWTTEDFSRSFILKIA